MVVGTGRRKAELTAIFLLSAVLLVALGGLVDKTVAANAAEPYPMLYVAAPAAHTVPGEKTVYLTFDDGPSRNTETVLDLLAEKGVPATFFVTAQNAGEDYTPLMLRRMLDEGHTIALHTYTHEARDIYRSVDSYLDDLNRINEYLAETVGVRPDILRFPGGSATVMAEPQTMRDIIREITRRGYQYYDWDVVSGDDTPQALPADHLAQRMLEGIQANGDKEQIVVLLHDNPAATTSAQAAGIVIDTLRDRGYRFDRLTAQVEPVHIKSTRLGNI